MKVSLLLAAAAAALPITEAITLNEKRTASPRVVGLDIKKRDYTSRQKVKNSHARFRKRGTVSETLDNEGTFYFANITLGTPAQTLHMTIDTGSSDLWVNAPNSTLCSERSDECSASGTYNAAKSSTYTYVNSDFNITYADGSGAAGDYVTDDLTIGGSSLSDFEFGIGYTSTSGQGVLGIGYRTNEAILAFQGETSYNNLPIAMTNAGLISTPAYSLWLNDLDSSEGSILFGGVNTGKYTGELQSVPILKEDGEYIEFVITLTGFEYATSSSGSASSISSSLPAAVLLDSGSSLTYLPDEIVEELYNAIGAEYVAEEGEAYVPCSLGDSGAYINYTFSSPTIQVTFSELLFEVTDEEGNPLTFSDGEQACIFGIAPAGGSTAVLGDTFLRSAYVVYDLNNNEIALAQTDFNSTSNNVKEISSGTSGIPGASYVATAVTTVAAQTGFAQAPGSATTVVETNAVTLGGTTATSVGGAVAALARPTGQAALGYLAAGAALVAAAL